MSSGSSAGPFGPGAGCAAFPREGRATGGLAGGVGFGFEMGPRVTGSLGGTANGAASGVTGAVGLAPGLVVTTGAGSCGEIAGPVTSESVAGTDSGEPCQYANANPTSPTRSTGVASCHLGRRHRGKGARSVSSFARDSTLDGELAPAGSGTWITADDTLDAAAFAGSGAFCRNGCGPVSGANGGPSGTTTRSLRLGSLRASHARTASRCCEISCPMTASTYAATSRAEARQ